MKIYSGLTSVTFRQLTPDEIIDLAVQAGLDGIEWGGDVHVPPGDTALAEKIGERTRAAGLQVLSYGSYYRCTAEEDPAAVLAAAQALGAPNIRVWAGKTDAAEMDDCQLEDLARTLDHFAAAAEKNGMTVSTEYHTRTATSTPEMTQRLLDRVLRDNFFTYFQPDNRRTDEENLLHLNRFLPRISNLHVFHWKSWTERFALENGEAIWKKYLETFARSPRASGASIMEFVRDDSPGQFLADAETLRRWIRELSR